MKKNSHSEIFLFLGSLALFLLLPNLGYPAFRESHAGSRGAQFLKLPVGAKAIGMGEAQTAISNDANAIFYNAGGLANLKEKQAEYMFARQIGNTYYHWAAVALPIKGRVKTMGVAIQYYSLGNIDETNVSGNRVGTFNPNDLAIHFSLADRISDFPFGLNIKFIQTKIKETATAFAFDFGIQYAPKDNRLFFGFSIQNIGSAFRFENEKSKLPILIRAGSGYQIRKNWVVAADAILPEDNAPLVALGTDYQYKILDNMTLAGRLGYNSRSRTLEGFNGLSAGFGLTFSFINLDYAWMPLGILGDLHRISLGVKY